MILFHPSCPLVNSHLKWEQYSRFTSKKSMSCTPSRCTRRSNDLFFIKLFPASFLDVSMTKRQHLTSKWCTSASDILPRNHGLHFRYLECLNLTDNWHLKGGLFHPNHILLQPDLFFTWFWTSCLVRFSKYHWQNPVKEIRSDRLISPDAFTSRSLGSLDLVVFLYDSHRVLVWNFHFDSGRLEHENN